jgi:oligosaccharyltransferase complex subunit epsilon
MLANLRIQANPENFKEFSSSQRGKEVERAFADFVFCSLLLYLFVINYIG